MVNARGRVMWLRPWEVENIRKQGGRVISNPKEEYYPELDMELNKTTLRGDLVINESPDLLSDKPAPLYVCPDTSARVSRSGPDFQFGK